MSQSSDFANHKSQIANHTWPVLPPAIDFGREICGDLAAAEAREWLVTNGIGGFACGTVAGTLTRRYHGLLVAALPPAVASHSPGFQN